MEDSKVYCLHIVEEAENADGMGEVGIDGAGEADKAAMENSRIDIVLSSRLKSLSRSYVQKLLK